MELPNNDDDDHDDRNLYKDEDLQHGWVLHICPTQDIAPHILSNDCPCRPFGNDDQQVVHNAWDGRELYETKKRKPH